MRTPDPPVISLIPADPFTDAPYAGWAAYCTSVTEVLRLADLLKGISPAWIEWAERRVRAAEVRGVRLRKPLAYRVGVLWNGIIHLQEAKFICDALENALREAATRHLAMYNVPLAVVAPALPAGRSTANPRDVNDQLQRALGAWLRSLTFYQLTELYARFWMSLPAVDAVAPGFRHAFSRPARCRSVAAFQTDMATIRHRRNEIALHQPAEHIVADGERTDLLVLVVDDVDSHDPTSCPSSASRPARS